MTAESDRSAALKRLAPIILTVVTAGVILLVLGLLYNRVTPDPVEATPSPARTATGVAAVPWPTGRVTFTPAPSATHVPTRPPIPTATHTPTITPTPTPTLPPVTITDIRELLELNVLQFEGSTIVEKERREWWERD